MMDGAEPGDHGQHFWIVPVRASKRHAPSRTLVAAKTDVSARRAIEWHKITETVLQPYYDFKLMRAFSSGPCICDCGMMDGAEPGDHGQHFWIHPTRAEPYAGGGED
jgi:hypothetical protein